MKQLKQHSLVIFAAVLTMCFTQVTWAAPDRLARQFSFTTGMVQGSYSSPLVSQDADGEVSESNTVDQLNGGFSVVPSIQGTLEIFPDSFRSSMFAKTVIAMDSATGKMKYNYLGIGMNTYYGGYGVPRNYSEQGFTYKADPKTRKYYGWDVGLSRVLVASFSTSLSAVSTALDFGGHWGMIKMMGESWGLNVEVGASYAFGFSTVAVSGTNIKIFVGGTYGL